MGSSARELPEKANGDKMPSVKRVRHQIPVPKTAPSRNLRSRSQNATQSSLSNLTGDLLLTGPQPASQSTNSANTQLIPTPQVPTRTAPTKALDALQATPPKEVTRKVVKKPVAQLYCLTKSGIPDNIGGLQVSQSSSLQEIRLLILAL